MSNLTYKIKDLDDIFYATKESLGLNAYLFLSMR